MNLQLLDFDCSDDADGVVCWDALAQPDPAFNPALLQEVVQVLVWAHAFDSQGPGPLENGANWDLTCRSPCCPKAKHRRWPPPALCPAPAS